MHRTPLGHTTEPLIFFEAVDRSRVGIPLVEVPDFLGHAR
jgi:hypothetical protein